MIKKVMIDKANRLYQMPLDIMSYLPSSEHRLSIRHQEDLIDLAAFKWPIHFSSDQIPDQKSFQPASKEKLNTLKEELASWMAANHQVKLNPEKEILIGPGISSMTFAISLAFIDHGDLAFVPNLGLPTFQRAVIASGGDSIGYSVSAKNNWLPDFSKIGTQLGRVARVLFLNSPHNPTGAELSEKALSELIWKASRENLLIVNDAAYQGIPARLPISLLSVEGGKRVGIELYSFSYQFGLPSMPFGFAVGNREALSGLKTALSLMNPQIPEYLVEMAIRAIRQYPNNQLKETRTLIQQTSAEAIGLLNELSLEVSGSPTVPFLWARIEKRRPSTTIARLLYRRGRILVVPGTSFGENGQGFLRFSLTTGRKPYTEALERVKIRLKLLREKD
jgi:LL-diaminopimelate aminotransferase